MEWGEAREEEVVDGGQLITRQPATSGGSIRPGTYAPPWVQGTDKARWLQAREGDLASSGIPN